MPFFSIVVPCYNREKVIGRCLESIIQQKFTDFEVIIVDDGSSDSSVEKIKKHLGGGFKLIKHGINLGVGPARNSGFLEAQGEWIIPLDSDDELTSDALELVFKVAKTTGKEINTIKFMAKYENGELTPNPPFIDEIWKYEDYIGKLDGFRHSDGPSVYRNRLNNKDIWPKSRCIETLFHLNQRKEGQMRTVPFTIAVFHKDAGNQLTTLKDRRKIILMAPDMVQMIDDICKYHGDAIKCGAPNTYVNLLGEGCKQSLLAGQRIKALRFYKQVREKQRSPRMFLYLLLGLISKHVLALAISLYRKASY